VTAAPRQRIARDRPARPRARTILKTAALRVAAGRAWKVKHEGQTLVARGCRGGGE